LNEAEASRKRDKEKGKDEVAKELGTKEGMQKYAKDRASDFERLRREIQDRQRGSKESAIEVE
jgi:E3 ubiquitin-protein ligase RAD18